jgi:geranylgeranyl reductase family protein
MYDVIVVGASVSGLRTAELISSQGYKVLVLEEHEKIGKPLKCAGLVSWRIFELIPDLPKEIIINEVKRAKFFSPCGNSFFLESKKSVYVIDREKFDKYLATRALKSNCDIRLNTALKDLGYENDCIKVFTNKGNFETKILVGADGANSLVARKLGLQQGKNFLVGMQATVKGNFENSVELWFGQKIAPGFFAWVIPENEKRARIGLATEKKTKLYFEKFLEKRVGKKVRPNAYGLIRFGLMKKTFAKRALLVGDAACMVKPFSGGGIIYGLIGSSICAEACTQALKKEEFSEKFFAKVYEKEWKRKLAKAILKGMLCRKFLSGLSDWQLNALFCFLKHEKNFLEKLDMDFLQFDANYLE